MAIRDAAEDDFERVLALNEAEVQHTSPMDLDRLRHLHELSSYHRVALIDGEVVGFLLAMGDCAGYENDNFDWFAARFPAFLYVDRIVIAAEAAGQKLGSALYADLFDFARARGAPCITCEFNLDPPNEPSAAFHRKWGFREVGTQRLDGGRKLVSMQLADT